MKLHCEIVIKRLDGQPVMVDQQVIQHEGKPVTINNIPQLGAGHPLTVGEALATMLTTKHQTQFSLMKSYALAQRFYKSEVTDLDDSDHSSLREVVEKNDQFTPLVLAQVLQVLMDCK